MLKTAAARSESFSARTDVIVRVLLGMPGGEWGLVAPAVFKTVVSARKRRKVGSIPTRLRQPLPHPAGTVREQPQPEGELMERRKTAKRNVLSRFASAATAWTGSTPAFITAALVVVVWLITGPLFHFSDTWQLVINTGTTIVTFLMVFLIQRSQNKDALAIQLKLNELVASIEGASNRLISVEDLSEDELKVLHIHYQRLAEMSKRESDVKVSHSIEEAEGRHNFKKDRRKGSTRKTS